MTTPTLYTFYGLGEVGSLTIALLNSNYSNITINIIDEQDLLSGRLLDLAHAAACNNNTILFNNKALIEQSDALVFAAGASNLHGESRNSVAAKNKALASKLFRDQPFAKFPTIFVITNPVDAMSFWIQEIVKDKAQVIGTGTSLDSFRLKFIVSKYFQCEAADVQTMVLGEHGQYMVPVFSQTKIKGIPIWELASEDQLQLIKQELIQSAFAIRQTERSTKYGIAETCLQLIQWLNHKGNDVLTVSIPLPSSLAKEMSIHGGLNISLPCTIKRQKIVVEDLNVSELEMDQLRLAALNISELIQDTE